MSKFIHLHTHSHYSLLNALPKIPDLVQKAKDYGMESLALTDNGNMYGAIEFYKECQKKGLKPILGVDFYVAARTRNDREPRIDNKRTRLVLLARNKEGYKNLIKLVTAANLEGFYYKPRIDKELLEAFKNDLICISPSFSGDIAMSLKNGNEEGAVELINYYKNLFGDHFFIEVTHHPEVEGHEENMKKLIALAQKYEVPLVAAHDTYYLEPDERKARNTLVSIQNEFSERNFQDDESDFSFISPDTAEKYFKNLPEAIENCQKIADMCVADLELGKWLFPDYKVESGRTADDELQHLVYQGLERKKVNLDKITKTRIEYELGVIKTKGYAPYFLVVSDLLRFAHDNHILTTIRGSVAGSMVTYLAGITNVNPIAYKLPFERFLNPERPSAPDIDMDYADNRRDEMIAYAKTKYGNDKVAQIGTFGTMMARGAVRDVTRALGHEYSLGDQIAKLIPMGAQGFPMTIDRAFDEVPELKKLYKSKKEVREIIDMAKKIEGCARHISVHAAGVVISPIPLSDIVPLQLDPKSVGDTGGKIITQYDMHSVDENNAGLLKFDFLGIRNLAILADAVSLAKKIEGVEVDIENVPLEDRKTFDLLAKGETVGLFQLNGAGMTRFLKELKPSTIHDINAMVALYRPGPMETIPEYIKRKHDPRLVKYLDPRMKKYLEESHGLIVYQDDLLFSAIELAGYSWLEADKFRKAVGKKVPAEMAAQKEKLVSGIVKNGQTAAFAEKLWKLFEPFQAYGFNKAHAASYGKVAYQTAFMKANFPAIYMAAVLTAESGDVEKIAEIIAECKRMGIPVLPPNINESFAGFTVVKGKKNENGEEKDEIRFGLTTIKNFGEGIATTIITEREAHGKFKSLENFLDRIHDRNLNKKSLEALVKCGAMDEFGERGAMLANMEGILLYNKEQSRDGGAQDSLFGAAGFSDMPNLRLAPADPAKKSDQLLWEKELLGLYISGHPLDKHRERLDARNTNIVKTRESLKEGMVSVIAGIIEELKEIRTKKGDIMYFAKMADFSGSIEIVFFPKVCDKFKQMIILDNCVAVKGRMSFRNGTPSVIAEAVKVL